MTRATRLTMWCLLAVVASAAAVLSFASLRDLALVCGFTPGLAWLLPVVIDAGAWVGCLGWLGSAVDGRARRFARTLTWVLLVSSVGGNAVVHYVAAYSLRPHWALVVAVSAVAPAVLGAVVHLAVLLVAGRTPRPQIDADEINDPSRCDALAGHDPLTALIAEGAGRRKISRALGVSEHQARQLIAERTNGAAR